jgi:hypothetical protein
MRTLKLLAMAGLAMSTAACVESVDGNYGYSDGYYAPNQAYGQPAYYAPTYYAPTQVVTQTRYVPVAVPQHTFAPQTQARDQHTDHHDHPQASNTPPATHQPPGNDPHRGGNNGTSHDRNGDGRPDRNS